MTNSLSPPLVNGHSNDCAELIQQLEQLSRRFSNLLQLLKQERSALMLSHLEELEQLSEQKSQLTREIQKQEAHLAAYLEPEAADPLHTPRPIALGSRLHQWIKRQSSYDQQKLEPVHTSLGTVMEECKLHNTVNGKIVHRSQQTVSELLRILHGTAGESLYDAQGTANHSATGATLAQA